MQLDIQRTSSNTRADPHKTEQEDLSALVFMFARHKSVAAAHMSAFGLLERLLVLFLVRMSTPAPAVLEGQLVLTRAVTPCHSS